MSLSDLFCVERHKKHFLDLVKNKIDIKKDITVNKDILNHIKNVLRIKNNQEIKIIRNHINELNLTGFIVGIPLNEEGQMTTQAIDCKNYGQLLSNELKLPFSYVNEHSSTWESSERFGIKKDKSGLIDSFSAKIILEQWIEEGPELEEIAGNRQIKY